MKIRLLFGLACLVAASSYPALAQTAPGTTVAPGVPINSGNPTAPATGNGTRVPGQPGTTPPVATPPGTVYSAPSTKKAASRPAKTSKPARAQ